MHQREIAHKLIASRKPLTPAGGFQVPRHQGEAEGGCGVIGMASNTPLAARHMFRALQQMRNRGNGKGGGIAAVGLLPEQFGVSREILDEDYLLAVAYLDPLIQEQLEQDFIYAVFDVDHVHDQPQLADFRAVDGLEVPPPEVRAYFVRPKPRVLSIFEAERGLAGLPPRHVEDEFVFQNTYELNRAYYASTGEKQAFVLSHGKNMLVLKMVGYGDDVIRYYQLEDLHAHVWIGHHRYPTKGRVWHPGGAHPFVGLNEALVHNGDFANYASISEYLAQRNIYPLFLTDTEVSVQVFDLLYRTYNYPLEYVIESLAPTTERDFFMLPSNKRRVYGMLQSTHMHSSPDGPWLFLIAQSDREQGGDPVYRLTGITDTSMLRPQVFAWQESTQEDGSPLAIGFAASEKQAIDAALESLAAEDIRFWSRPDRYWNARGGSHTDGGAFVFSVRPNGNGRMHIECADKFGRQVKAPTNSPPYRPNGSLPWKQCLELPAVPDAPLFPWVKEQLLHWDYDAVIAFLEDLEGAVAQFDRRRGVIDLLTLLMNHHYPTGKLRRSSLLSLYDRCFSGIVETIRKSPSEEFVAMRFGEPLPTPSNGDHTLVLDARGYSPEGEGSLAREIRRLYENGFRSFILAHARGHRFIGNGLGQDTQGLRIDVYGSSGDYLGSGIDGLEMYVHGNAQDQLAQIMKSGKLVVYGDVGQTFMYGAKGGEAYVLGNAAGRPLINAVGKPRVVINGTCLDYLAESFMAGDPLNGGGFVVLNGLAFDEDGGVMELESPYPGSNLFSLASGGAIYLRDPHHVVSSEQLNGGEFSGFTPRDWALIEPYLEENARLFGLPLERLLEVEGQLRQPGEVYRKIQPRAVRALQAEEAWVTEHN